MGVEKRCIESYFRQSSENVWVFKFLVISARAVMAKATVANIECNVWNPNGSQMRNRTATIQPPTKRSANNKHLRIAAYNFKQVKQGVLALMTSFPMISNSTNALVFAIYFSTPTAILTVEFGTGNQFCRHVLNMVTFVASHPLTHITSCT